MLPSDLSNQEGSLIHQVNLAEISQFNSLRKHSFQVCLMRSLLSLFEKKPLFLSLYTTFSNVSVVFRINESSSQNQGREKGAHNKKK